MAAEVGLSRSAVHRIWKAFGLQPHRQDTWKLSKDPQFVAKVRDVVGLYLNPPPSAPWSCASMRSPRSKRYETAPVGGRRPGVRGAA
jgi:alpha-beta hydrolase superfamily lysophospholipase